MLSKSRERSKGMTVLALSIVVGGMALFGCSSNSSSSTTTSTSSAGGETTSWSKIVSAANQEGSLTVYSTAAPAIGEATTLAFEKAYPQIKVTLLRLTSPQIEQRVDAEHTGGIAGSDSIIIADPGYVMNHEKDGYFSKLQGPNIKALSSSLQDPKGKYFIASASPWGYAWNSSGMPTQPTAKSLLTSKYDNMIGLQDYVGQNAVILLYKLLSDNYKATTGKSNFLNQLAALHPKFYPGTPAVAQAIGSGELNASLTMPPAAVPAGIPVKVAFSEAVPSTPINVQVMASAKSPNAAQVFANFLATRPGQTAFTTGQIADLPNIEGSIDIPIKRVQQIDTWNHDQAFYTSYAAKLNQIFGR